MTSGMISLTGKDPAVPCWHASAVSPQQHRVARSLSAQLGAAPGEERQAILSFLDSGESRLFSRSCSWPAAEPATHAWPLTPQQHEQAQQQQRVPPSSKVRGVAVMTTTMPVSSAHYLPAHPQAGQLGWGYL